jgi:hypothetical protein
MSATEQISEEKECQKKAEILRAIASDMEDMLRKKLEGTDIVDVECAERFGRYVYCEIGRKYMEIVEGFSEYCEEEGLDEDACEEEFMQAYEEELERINEESMIDVRAVISTAMFEIEVEPLPCDGDYCVAGAGVTVFFRGDIEHFADESYRKYWLDKVAEVTVALLREL